MAKSAGGRPGVRGHICPRSFQSQARLKSWLVPAGGDVVSLERSPSQS